VLLLDGNLAFCFLFLSCCIFSANAEVLDIQLPGQPATSLNKGFTLFLLSPLSSPALGDFLTSESTVFLALQGNLSDYYLSWTVDGGANRHIHSGLRAFSANYRTVNINITVAKQNITMQAIGVGDCEVHVMDNMGSLYKFVLKNVLYVPEAGKNVISSFLSWQRWLSDSASL
jgi:hypothetical protein